MAKGNANSANAVSARRLRPDALHASPAISGASLSQMVESEIIPRLLLAHGHRSKVNQAPANRNDSSDNALSLQEIAWFAPLPLTLEADELLEKVEQFLARGVTIEQVFVNLLAPSARRLGELWEQDSCDFVDVTMGLWRLQEVMRIVSVRMPVITSVAVPPPAALFAPIPGDDHSFGALMIEEIFARAGWETEVVFEPSRARLLDLLAARRFDLMGLTVTNDCPSGTLAEIVSAIRSVSRNPAIRILVGGRAINADPALSAAAGADGTASDAQLALILAEEMMAASRSIEMRI